MAGKADLVKTLANSIDGMSQAAAAEVIDTLLEEITETLVRGDKVSLPGFGTFSVSRRAAREGRNPATGATMQIPAKTVAKFKPGKALADAVNA